MGKIFEEEISCNFASLANFFYFKQLEIPENRLKEVKNLKIKVEDTKNKQILDRFRRGI